MSSNASLSTVDYAEDMTAEEAQEPETGNYANVVFQNDFGSEEHKIHLQRTARTDIERKQLQYLEQTSEYDLTEIYQLFGYTPSSINISRSTLQVQQYIKDKILYKQHSRKASWSELMFDLVFVSVFHVLAQPLRDESSLDDIRLYVSQFSLLWLTWGNTTLIVNMFVKDDVYERFFLIVMGSIVLGMGMNLYEYGVIIYFLIGRLCMIATKFLFIFLEPDFKQYFIISILYSIAPLGLFIPVLGFDNPKMFETFIGIFIICELIAYALVRILIKFVLNLHKIPVISIPHAKDRTGLLTIVALGEITFSLLIDSTSLYAFLISVCGLIVASRIQYIYFKTESESNHIERVSGKHRVYVPLWFFLHLPLQCAIALSGAALEIIVHNTVRIEDPDHVIRKNSKDFSELDQQFEFAEVLYFSCLSMVMLCLSLMSIVQSKICEKSLKKDWKLLFGSVNLMLLFMILAITCRYFDLEIYVVGVVSAFLMMILSGVAEWEEAKRLWKNK